MADAEKSIVHKLPPEQGVLSIETMKVGEDTLNYLRNNGFNVIKDIIPRQQEIPKEHIGKIYAYLMFGVEYK